MVKGFSQLLYSNVKSALLILLFIIVNSSDSFAGDYHRTPAPSLICAQCHMMHYTQGGGNNFLHYDNSSQINAKLLRRNSVVSLCKYCHEQDNAGLGAPDLFDPIYNASAGDFEVYNDSGGTDIEEKRRHSIENKIPSSAIHHYPPGMDDVTKPAWDDALQRYAPTFTCIYCHDQHGNSNYRNFRPNPMDPNDRDPATAGAQVTYCDQQGSPNTKPCDSNEVAVVQAITDGLGDGPSQSPPESQYVTSNMTFRSHTNQIAGFCGRCHVKFYGTNRQVNNENQVGGFDGSGDSKTGTSPGAESQWLRHPVGSIAIEVGNGHTDPDHFNSIAPDQRVRHINSTLGHEPFCLTCHRSHGSTNHSNLIFGPPTELGGGGNMIRDTCQQCHNQ